LKTYDDSKVSREKQCELIAEAEAKGWTWYYDLGELDDGTPVNLLIIKD